MHHYSDPQPGDHPALRIDCDTCVARDTEACDDCLMTFLVRDHSEGAVVIDLAEARALRMFGSGGLVPQLRHEVDSR